MLCDLLLYVSVLSLLSSDHSPILIGAPSSESLHSAAADLEHSSDHPGGGGGVSRNPHEPPTWRSHTSDDILNDVGSKRERGEGERERGGGRERGRENE